MIRCNKLLVADDLKLYSKIMTIEACLQLRENIDAVTRWCGGNRLSLNIDKCNVACYTRKQNVIAFPYGIPLVRINSVKDLIRCNI